LSPTPEQEAREVIDTALVAAGWLVQDKKDANIDAGLGVAVREGPTRNGPVDYLLFVGGKVAGAIEAKKVGETLSGVEVQLEKYTSGLPAHLPAHLKPLPFGYISTGVETYFVNGLDPKPRSRRVFQFHRPEVLAEWLTADPMPGTKRPSTLRSRLLALPALDDKAQKLWPAQGKAIRKLEESLAANKQRALIQMATGSGKSRTAVASIYRLIRYGGAKRVLFLVDRGNLGKQALTEFEKFDTPEGRKFHQEFIVHRLTSNSLPKNARVVICTIQRLYAMLQGEEIDEEADETSAFTMADMAKPPAPVTYNPSIPVETFDFIWTDECHRSIYNLWRQVLEYFDSFLVGLTATPSKQTLGFFNQNLVMDYGHEAAVADGCNVDFSVFEIETKITQGGSRVEAGFYVGKRDRETRATRWEKLDDDLVYGASELDRAVVAPDQIRKVLETFRDNLSVMFPGRTVVPKTLIFAKDDNHAEEIVRMVREVFGESDQFAEKITYKSGTARIPTGKVDEKGQPIYEYKSTGLKPDDLLSSFRNAFLPRIAVTVDLIATGTDVKPLEVVFFMRSVRSRLLFEQMKGRGVRVVSDADFKAVSEAGAPVKDHFVIVDAVGVCHSDMADTQPLDKRPSVPFEALVQAVALGSTDREIVSSLTSRLARMDRQITAADQDRIRDLTGGVPLKGLVAGLVDALDPDRQVEAARLAAKLPEDALPTSDQIAQAAERLIAGALAPLKSNGKLRVELVDMRKAAEQTIDSVSQDEVLRASFSDDAKEKAKGLVADWEKFIADNKDEITALQVIYSRPYKQRLRFKDIKELVNRIQAPPRTWTPEKLWRAYETLEKSKVRGAGAKRLLTDIVSLVRFAIHQDEQLVPFSERVDQRFQNWMAVQENKGAPFTPEQREWLVAIKDHIATSYGIDKDDFSDVPFNQKGGLGRVYELFGERLDPLLRELNEALVA
jgi:type I restriction enzyme R subunit